MRIRIAHIAAGLSLTAASLLAASTSHASTRPQPVPRACTVAVSGTIMVQPMSSTVRATLSDSLTGTVSASFPAASKITVDSVWRGSSATAYSIAVNASQAMAGKYTVTLSNGTMSCTGDATVVSGH